MIKVLFLKNASLNFFFFYVYSLLFELGNFELAIISKDLI